MTHNRKNFNYQSANVDAVTEHFLKSSRQAVAAVRKFWADDECMTVKLDTAFYQMKMKQAHDKLTQKADHEKV